MIFILSSDETYNEKYEHEAYKYIRVQDVSDLVGFPKIILRIHNCWMEDCNDERIDYLQQQLEALADFGYIKLTYVDDDGFEQQRYAEKAITDSRQGYPTGPIEKSSQSLSEAQIERIMADEEDGCGSGGCVI